MGLFGFGNNASKVNEGGFMDAIRCDEPSYLIWKWRPAGQEANTTKKENAIRYGSTVRVKDGEVAVFVYNQKDGTQQDFIEGPFDKKIETANFPVLASIVGLAFGGASPFQAEVYYINLAGIIQIKFAIPYFDVFDPRQPDLGVPVAVRGTMSFKIADYREFIKLHRLANFDLDAFQKQIKDACVKYVKDTVINIVDNIPLVQIEKKIMAVSDAIEERLKKRLQSEFGVVVSSVDIATIEVDKTSDAYVTLKSVTQDIQTQFTKTQADVNLDTMKAQSAVNIQNMQDMQRINAENMEESLRIQREEAQRAQKLQTEGANFMAHQLNQQTKVALAGTDALGQLGANGGMNMGGNGAFNPGAMMASMAVGGAVGQNMAGMMNNMMGGMQGVPGMTPNMAPPPPPMPPQIQFNVVVNGQSAGPFDMNALQQMIAAGTLTKDTLVWKVGMPAWAAASTVPELASLFTPAVPPVPPVPGNPGVPPVPPSL